LRVGDEDGRLRRVVDVLLDLSARFRLQLPDQAEEARENDEVVLLLRNGILQGLHEADAAVLDRLHWIGDDKGSDGGAEDDDVLPRLPDDGYLAAHGREATEHAHERHY